MEFNQSFNSKLQNVGNDNFNVPIFIARSKSLLTKVLECIERKLKEFQGKLYTFLSNKGNGTRSLGPAKLREAGNK